MNTVIVALQNTLILMLATIIIGRTIDLIIEILLKIMSKHLGSKFTLLFANRLTFIGTIHHELSHAIVLLLTGAQIVKIDLFKPQGNRLGQVKYINRGNIVFRSIQNTLSSIAPVLIGIISETLIYKALGLRDDWWFKLTISYIMISILLHMTMSKQDLKAAIKGLPICSIIIFILMYITKFNIIAIL